MNEPWEVSRVRVDTRLPLLADDCAAMVNVSIQSLDREPGLVSFYAPVFAGVHYRFADAVEDYSKRFMQAMPSAAAASCSAATASSITSIRSCRGARPRDSSAPSSAAKSRTSCLTRRRST
nr:hypothetical protein [Pseudomonas sp. IT1137]